MFKSMATAYGSSSHPDMNSSNTACSLVVKAFKDMDQEGFSGTRKASSEVLNCYYRIERLKLKCI